MNEPLPCPFCGKPPIKGTSWGEIVYYCEEHTENLDLDEWNRRIPILNLKENDDEPGN